MFNLLQFDSVVVDVVAHPGSKVFTLYFFVTHIYKECNGLSM